MPPFPCLCYERFLRQPTSLEECVYLCVNPRERRCVCVCVCVCGANIVQICCIFTSSHAVFFLFCASILSQLSCCAWGIIWRWSCFLIGMKSSIYMCVLLLESFMLIERYSFSSVRTLVRAPLLPPHFSNGRRKWQHTCKERRFQLKDSVREARAACFGGEETKNFSNLRCLYRRKSSGSML